jgi:hypothetical protein
MILADAQHDDASAAPNVEHVLSAAAVNDAFRRQLSGSAILQGRATYVCIALLATAGLGKGVQRQQQQLTHARNTAKAKSLGTTFLCY